MRYVVSDTNGKTVMHLDGIPAGTFVKEDSPPRSSSPAERWFLSWRSRSAPGWPQGRVLQRRQIEPDRSAPRLERLPGRHRVGRQCVCMNVASGTRGVRHLAIQAAVVKSLTSSMVRRPDGGRKIRTVMAGFVRVMRRPPVVFSTREALVPSRRALNINGPRAVEVTTA